MTPDGDLTILAIARTVNLLKTAVIGDFHRLGLFEYLRDSWRADLGKKGDRDHAIERTAGKLNTPSTPFS